jgi:hypothetical protein
LLAFGVTLGGSIGPDGAPSLGAEASATTSLLMTLDELCKASDQIALVEPLERTSRWEQLGGSKRIVTYTRLSVVENVAGKKRSELWVRTLGGTVDRIGQYVAGEASFTIGERSVVFLADMDGVPVVTGLAQGHFPLELKENELVLRSSPDPGNLLPRKSGKGSAREALVGAKLDPALSKIRTAFASSKR